jgi:hypothetical protein
LTLVSPYQAYPLHSSETKDVHRLLIFAPCLLPSSYGGPCVNSVVARRPCSDHV